ncbi:MAG: polysaccharide deacetylase family protein [Synergistaceae bacterium]
MNKLAIKVDIDTLRGYREGMPNMLNLFKKHSISASIFFSFGPDNSGKAIRRIFRKGFISKMLRTKAPSTYGIKTLLYGTLLPAPLIVSSAPEILIRAINEGHDCGIHAWDHVLVQDKLNDISKEQFIALFERSAKSFEKLSGVKPTCYAAPGWQVSAASLKAEEELELDYCSDARGEYPFLPVFEGKEYKVPQIPTTLPTMDEIYGLPGIDDETIPSYWLERMDKEYNVLTVHAEMEGLSKLNVFDNFLTIAKKQGVLFSTLKEYAKSAKFNPCKIKNGTMTGRAGTLAIQEVK